LHILMELVDGANLRHLMKGEKVLPLDLSASIGRSLARALEHLHAHRVVHRDLKPENVLIGHHGEIKLTDFGISRVEFAGLTRTGTLLGTPRYMSPEQLAGKKGEEIGPESDVYSLGILLYEMITGKDPYRLRKKAEILEVINVRHTQQPRPLPKEIPVEFQELLSLMLEKSAEQRPSEARWIGQELGQWSISRRQLKQQCALLVEQFGPFPKKARMLPLKKKEMPSTQPDLLEETRLDAPPLPTHGHELLPAFVLTLVFLISLLALGWWSTHHRSTAPALPQPTQKPAHSTSYFLKPTSATTHVPAAFTPDLTNKPGLTNKPAHANFQQRRKTLRQRKQRHTYKRRKRHRTRWHRKHHRTRRYRKRYKRRWNRQPHQTRPYRKQHNTHRRKRRRQR
ncbi:MAG: serine/threonine-protein kinase, partial [Myxococcota bacterium]